MKVAIIGLGFVGLSLASVLASKGLIVTGLDIDKKKCHQIQNGILPFFEPNLENILRKIVKMLEKTFLEKQEVFIMIKKLPKASMVEPHLKKLQNY